MRDRSFVFQMMLLAVGLAIMWTWALQAVESNDDQRRAGAALDQARRAAAIEEMRSTVPIRTTPNATTSSSLVAPAPASAAPASNRPAKSARRPVRSEVIGRLVMPDAGTTREALGEREHTSPSKS